jgi:hypothetical protein
MSKQGGIKAGAAYVELSMRDSVTEPLRRAEKRMELFGEKVKEIGSAVAMAGAAVAAFGGAIVGAAAASVAAFAKIAGDFSDLAAQTGGSLRATGLCLTARSFAYLLGAACGPAFDRVPGHVLLTAAMALCCAGTALVPAARSTPAIAPRSVTGMAGWTMPGWWSKI